MASNLETKIDRIATAVTSALSALTAKGVTVPAGANVESLAALIEGIEAGGGGGGGSVEPFTKVLTGTVTFAVNTTEFALPETENFLAAYFIRTDFWGVKENIWDNGAQIVLFASGQSIGDFSSSSFTISTTKYQHRDIVDTKSYPTLSDGKLTFPSTIPCFYGSYYYALLYGTK